MSAIETTIHIRGFGSLLTWTPNNPDQLAGIFRAAGYKVVSPDTERASGANGQASKSLAAACRTCGFRTLLSTVDVVLLDVTMTGHDIIKTISELNALIGTCCLPKVLCFSTVHRNTEFVLSIQQAGARYTRVTDAGMLLEAIEILLAEIKNLEKNKPHFVIVHKFSQGMCAPGELVFAVMLKERDRLLPLPIAFGERLVFEVLARHRNIALDSFQIAACIQGEWFFRDHGLNGGSRQLAKIRRASVKVRVQRIRKGMASCFVRANLGLDPYETLRSSPAEGTNRVLYRLNGHVEWYHPLG